MITKRREGTTSSSSCVLLKRLGWREEKEGEEIRHEKKKEAKGIRIVQEKGEKAQPHKEGKFVTASPKK